MATTEAKRKANNKYTKAHYAEVRFYVKKGKRDVIDARASQLGLSRAAYLNGLVDQDLESGKET